MANEIGNTCLVTEVRQPSMERYQVILAYDGSHFKGFQRQANARSVQGVVENALRKLRWHERSILAAGRTDTGAHATGQVIAFDLDWKHGAQDLLTALNSHLPKDVVVRDVKKVCPAFHPRYDASWRKYQYRLYCQPVRQPLLESYAWRVWPAVDINALHEIAFQLIGTHDFGAFGAPPHSKGSTIRRVIQADWKLEEPYFVFEIAATAFLYHMVRRLVFTQVMVAQEKLTIDQYRDALQTSSEISNHDGNGQGLSRSLAHGLAPAQGLILAEVYYEPDTIDFAEDNEEK